MIIFLSILGYLVAGFIFTLIWAKFEPAVKYSAEETWWLVLSMVYWPVVLGFYVICCILYPIKILFHKLV